MLNYKYNLKELIDLLQEHKEVDIFVRDIFRFRLLCDENFGVAEVLFDLHGEIESKLAYMEKIMRGHFSDSFYNFITQLIKNNDIVYYEFISSKFTDLLSQENNCSYVEVVSAIPLSEEQSQVIKQEMQRIQQKDIYVYNSLSVRLLGGFVINCGEKMIDLSVQGGLEKFKVALVH